MYKRQTNNNACGIFCDTPRKRLLTIEQDRRFDFGTSGNLVVRDYSSGNALYAVEFDDATPIAIAVCATDGSVGLGFTDGSVRYAPTLYKPTLSEHDFRSIGGASHNSTCFACEFSPTGDMQGNCMFRHGKRLTMQLPCIGFRKGEAPAEPLLQNRVSCRSGSAGASPSRDFIAG